MGEREMHNMLPGDTTVRQNATEWIRRKCYPEEVIGVEIEVVIEVVRVGE